MKPFDHAVLSAKDFGGSYSDYIEIHKWFDQFRYALPNIMHRMFLHNTVGIIICEQVFGDYLENSEGKKIAVRDIAEHHILKDVGEIRTPQDWLNNLNNLDYFKPYPAKLDKILDKSSDDETEKNIKKVLEILEKNNKGFKKPFEESSFPFNPHQTTICD